MKKILFACHGNICRSPMAEFVFNDMVKKRGLEGKYNAESAATSTEEIGNPVYPPARRLLASKGISTAGKTARRIRHSDLDEYDLIIGMDSWNMRNLRCFFGESEKIRSLLDRDIADPWYTDDFETCYEDILIGCEDLLEELEG